MAADAEVKRSFLAAKDDGTTVALSVRKPKRIELEHADFEFSRVFNSALLHGLPTRTRQNKNLRTSGLWTEAEERNMEDLRRAAAKLEAQVAESKVAAPDKDDLETRRQAALAQFNESRRDIEAMLGHTADAKADLAYRNFLICCVTETEAGQRLWGDVDALLSDIDNSLVNRVLYEYMMFNAGLPSSYDEPAPGATVETPAAVEQAPVRAPTVAEGTPEPAPAQPLAEPVRATGTPPVTEVVADNTLAPKDAPFTVATAPTLTT